MIIVEHLEKALLADIAVGLDRSSLDPEEDLLEQGIIDSLGLMKLIAFMENNFGISIADDQIVPENFQSLNTMARLVEQQRQKVQAA